MTNTYVYFTWKRQRVLPYLNRSYQEGERGLSQNKIPHVINGRLPSMLQSNVSFFCTHLLPIIMLIAKPRWLDKHASFQETNVFKSPPTCTSESMFNNQTWGFLFLSGIVVFTTSNNSTHILLNSNCQMQQWHAFELEIGHLCQQYFLENILIVHCSIWKWKLIFYYNI